MPIINIAIAKGRSRDQKQTLVREISRVVAQTLSVDPEKIWIRIDEFEKDNFAVGGMLMSDRKSST
ncbi:MAG: 2-hydroxymuconate tautomerase family protein [Proteobacteria bacterium]|nr:2-hydroxymuconate tautomerase family protein [Pseudomonadota bacterium]